MRSGRLLGGISCFLATIACATISSDQPEPELATPEPEQSRTASLAERLPRDTILYGCLDLRRAIDEGLAYLRFIDPESAEQMRIQTERAYHSLVVMAANRGFKPQLAAAIAATRWHLIALPEELEAQAPGVGPRPRHQERLLGPDRVLALAIETDPAMATDFLAQVRAELERQSAKQPGRKDLTWVQIPVDGGDLIRLDGPGVYLGAKAGFLVLADGPPRRLWAALDAPAVESLADSDRFERAAVDDPTAFLVLDLRPFIRAADAAAKRERTEALAGLDAATKPVERQTHQIRLDAVETIDLVKRLIGLDRFVALGLRSEFEQGGDSVRFGLLGELMYEAPLTPIVEQAFDGGRAFRLPAAGLDGGLSMMWRLGLSEIYRLVGEGLGESQRQSLSMADALVMGYTGYAIGDLLGLFSGDFYLFSDLVENQAPSGDQGTQAMTDASVSPQSATTYKGSNLVAMGIVDRQATEQALLKLFEVAQANPTLAQMVGRMDYQGRSLFLFGPQAPGAGGEVQLEHAVVTALLDNHLVVGGFGEVSALIRAGNEPAAAKGVLIEPILKAHSAASFLLIMSQGMLQRLERFLDQSSGQTSVEELIASLRHMEMPLDGDAAEEDLRDALIRLLRHGDDLSRRIHDFQGPALVVHGRPVESAYRVNFEAELRRR